MHPLLRQYLTVAPPGMRGCRVQRFFGLPQTLALLESLRDDCSHATIARELGLNVQVRGLEHVPQGSLVVAANHPYMLVDRASLGSALEAHRGGPVRAVVASPSAPFVEMHPLFAFLGEDPADRQGFWVRSREFLQGGGAMTIFPAGQTLVRERDGSPRETPWRAGALKLAALSGAPLLPAYIDAPNGRTYQWLRRHFRREWVQLLNLREAHRCRRPVTVTFGPAVDPAATTPDTLRQAVYALSQVSTR